MAGVLCFLPEFPQGSLWRGAVSGLQSLMAETSLFTDMASSILFLILIGWEGLPYFKDSCN